MGEGMIKAGSIFSWSGDSGGIFAERMGKGRSSLCDLGWQAEIGDFAGGSMDI